MKRICIVLLFLSGFVIAQNTASQRFIMPSNINEADYLSNTVILRVKEQYRDYCSANSIKTPQATKAFSAVGMISVEKQFPNHLPPRAKFNSWGAPLEDISLIYTLKYSKDIKLEKAINALLTTGIFEYAEPYYIPTLSYTPNDPSANSTSQYYLGKVAAFTGWDISKGDTNVVVGITDTGVELTHPDLQGNIKYNYADPINGIDDDLDGYTDNFRGWDVGMNDNNPTWQANAHGVHVSGLSSATTDNGVGVAGVGFLCKFLPVKISDAGGALTQSYQGIVYAADHGCKVINCSWGGAGGGSYGQDIIDYATNNKDALVIAAAGNDGQDRSFYPASFDHVINIASTGSTDARSSFSNYGYNVDVCAPGSSDYSTWTNGGYASQSGTSMASPVAAGVAAIIRAYYPSYNALQAGERLKQTADNIYSSNSASFANKLGTGRVNLFRALTDPTAPSLVMTTRTETDGNDNSFVANDTLRIFGDFTNYLAPAANVTATISAVTNATYVTFIDNSTTLGAMNTLQTVNNMADPFLVKIASTAPANTSVIFKVAMTDGTMTWNKFFTVVVNVDYINITINDVHTSITSKGLIGYNLFGQQQGLGFNYKNKGSMLYEASLMIGTSSSQVSDRARSGASTTDTDFISQSPVRRTIPSVVSEMDLEGLFNDNGATNPIPVKVHHSAYAWSSPGNTKYVIVQYVITNTGAAPIPSLYAGIFADWDIDAATYADNRAEYDPVNKMGYVYHTDTNGVYCGIKLLTNTAPAVHYAIDNIQGGAGGLDLSDAFDDSEKYAALSTTRNVAGAAGNGEDVIDVMSSGPFAIASNDSVVVAFALIAGDSLADLTTSAVNAQIMYDTQIPLGVTQGSGQDDFKIYPNPAKNEVNLVLKKSSATISVSVIDLSGRIVFTEINENNGGSIRINTSDLETGVYFIKAESAEYVTTKKLVIAK